MNVVLSALYDKGKKLPEPKIRPLEGDLNMTDSLSSVRGRICSEAILSCEDGNQLAPLYDVRLLGISAHGFRLRGTEIIGDREYAQEWWVRVHTKKETTRGQS